MSENKNSKIVETITSVVTVENIQKYVLGNKKSGQPRALYDLIKDFRSKKGKKKKSKSSENGYSLYLKSKKGKKKKKSKKDKYWHI